MDAVDRLSLGQLRLGPIDFCGNPGLFTLELVERERVREVCLEQLLPFELSPTQVLRCVITSFSALKLASSNKGTLVGGPGFEPGASRPQPCRLRVLECPGGSEDAPWNSNCRSLVPVRVLLEPPSAGNLCPGCAPSPVQISPAVGTRSHLDH